MLADFAPRQSTIRAARGYHLTVNTAWEQVIAGIWDEHGVNWMFPSLADTFRQLQPPSPFGTRMYSVELWKGSDLVAAEVGYANGGTYTSLSGYYRKNYPNAGRLQLTALGCLLKRCGFVMWDWGMYMDYKVDYGGRKVPRDLFFSLYAQHLALTPLSLEAFLATHSSQASDLIRAS
jgi:Leu/Phe-tRNA-protein transferase